MQYNRVLCHLCDLCVWTLWFHHHHHLINLVSLLVFDHRLCQIQTLSSAVTSLVSLCCQRPRADRLSTMACSPMPGPPPLRATSTSTRRRRMAVSTTPSATVWKQASGKSCRQRGEKGRLRCPIHQGHILRAMLRRYNLGWDRNLQKCFLLFWFVTFKMKC